MECMLVSGTGSHSNRYCPRFLSAGSSFPSLWHPVSWLICVCLCLCLLNDNVINCLLICHWTFSTFQSQMMLLYSHLGNSAILHGDHNQTNSSNTHTHKLFILYCTNCILYYLTLPLTLPVTCSAFLHSKNFT